MEPAALNVLDMMGKMKFDAPERAEGFASVFPPRASVQLTWVLLAGLLLAPGTAISQSCRESDGRHSDGTLNLKLDNDMFGGQGQDQNYTNGILFTWVSPNLAQDDACLPALARGLKQGLDFLKPEGSSEQNVTMGIGQAMYTPTNKRAPALVENDRPYAGALMASLGYDARQGNHLHSTQLRFGVVGPAAQAEDVQQWWHDLVNSQRPMGWDNQLHNEPVFQMLYERRTRAIRQESGSFGWDLIPHWGGSVGNFASYANAGAELRFGLHLPDDFGTATLRPAGGNSWPIRPSSNRWSGHLFIALDARAVLHDITLDGNSFRDSHSVDKRPFVADLGIGIAMQFDEWRVTFGRYYRTREFDGQQDTPAYGSLTIGRRF
jgi:hypothetical protein